MARSVSWAHRRPHISVRDSRGDKQMRRNVHSNLLTGRSRLLLSGVATAAVVAGVLVAPTAGPTAAAATWHAPKPKRMKPVTGHAYRSVHHAAAKSRNHL